MYRAGTTNSVSPNWYFLNSVVDIVNRYPLGLFFSLLLSSSEDDSSLFVFYRRSNSRRCDFCCFCYWSTTLIRTRETTTTTMIQSRPIYRYLFHESSTLTADLCRIIDSRGLGYFFTLSNHNITNTIINIQHWLSSLCLSLSFISHTLNYWIN